MNAAGQTPDAQAQAQAQAPAKPPPLLHDTAPPDRYCDVVLTGGVTSGIVYPLALLELARHYRFKNIAGTSAGAMAAALAAAAELSRRQGRLVGFEVLRCLPTELASDAGGQTRMQSLFQPAPGTARLMALFLQALRLASAPPADAASKPGLGARLYRVVRAVLQCYPGAAALGATWAAALLLALQCMGLASGLPGWALGLALGASVGCVVGLWRDITGPLVANGFGICVGTGGGAGSKQPALVDWLHNGIQAAAGKRPDDDPVTFCDLWHAKGGPPDVSAGAGPDRRSIDLRMVSTNLTLGRPIQWPLDASADPANTLYFDPEELARYLPATVLAYLVQQSSPADPALERQANARAGSAASPGPDSDSDPDDTARQRLRQLPQGRLPIVLAARLSLSFPFLLSAVPLWALDGEAPPGRRRLRRCWFSDGGLCANFPIHLFDATVPRWPTFGISLGQRSAQWSQLRDAVWLPHHHSQGQADAWHRFDDERAGATRLWGFLGGLLNSAKNWHDNTQMRLPGVRDRVVRIGFEPGEGELNLGMTHQQMLRIARLYGRRAGRMLARRFVPPNPSPSIQPAAWAADQPASGQHPPAQADPAVPAPGAGWPEHRWVRLNLLNQALRHRLIGLGAAVQAVPGSPGLAQQVAQAFVHRPLAGTDASGAALSAAQADAMDHLLKALADAEAAFAPPGGAPAHVPQPYTPQPMPVLAIRPPV